MRARVIRTARNAPSTHARDAHAHRQTDGRTDGRTVIVDLAVAVDIGCPDHVVDLLAAEPLAQTVHRRPQLVGVDLTAAVKVKHCRADTTVTSAHTDLTAAVKVKNCRADTTLTSTHATHVVADVSDVSTHQHTRRSSF